ncbi:MAG: biotin/lipoyl-containing protein [Opitutaceae bacterium]
MKYIATIGENAYTISIDGQDTVKIDDRAVPIDMQASTDGTLHSLLINGRSHAVRLQANEDCYRVQIGGEIYEVVVEDERTHRLAGVKSALGGQAGEVVIKAPMPGVIVETSVAAGDTVTKGQTLVVLESMKMHNEFKAPKDGTIHALRVKKGDKVDKNAVMLTLH